MVKASRSVALPPIDLARSGEVFAALQREWDLLRFDGDGVLRHAIDDRPILDLVLIDGRHGSRKARYAHSDGDLLVTIDQVHSTRRSWKARISSRSHARLSVEATAAPLPAGNGSWDADLRRIERNYQGFTAWLFGHQVKGAGQVDLAPLASRTPGRVAEGRTRIGRFRVAATVAVARAAPDAELTVDVALTGVGVLGRLVIGLGSRWVRRWLQDELDRALTVDGLRDAAEAFNDEFWQPFDEHGGIAEGVHVALWESRQFHPIDESAG